MNAPSSITFSAKTMHGAGRGKGLNAPTINMDTSALPKEFHYGVYASRVTLPDGSQWVGALHYGPRIVFDDQITCEVHLLDAKLTSKPEEVTVTIVERMRDVQDFQNPEDLKKQIAEDIAQIRRILPA